MTAYRIFDLVLSSTAALPELPAITMGATAARADVATDEVDLRFELADAIAKEPPPVAWIHQWRAPNGQITLSHARQGGGHLLRFPRLGDFHVADAGRAISCQPRVDVPEATLRHLLLDQVIPRVISHYRGSVLHASAVLLPAGAVAFLGDTGWGKSTLGLSFEEDGHPLLGDDALFVDATQRPPRVVASYPGARLWHDSFDALAGGVVPTRAVAHYSTKQRVVPQRDAPPPTPEQAPLRAFFLLDDPRAPHASDAVHVEPVRGARAAMALVEHCFHLDVKDRARIASQFDELTGVVASGCAFFRLRYPRRHERLAEVRDAVRAAIAALDQRP